MECDFPLAVVLFEVPLALDDASDVAVVGVDAGTSGLRVVVLKYDVGKAGALEGNEVN